MTVTEPQREVAMVLVRQGQATVFTLLLFVTF